MKNIKDIVIVGLVFVLVFSANVGGEVDAAPKLAINKKVAVFAHNFDPDNDGMDYLITLGALRLQGPAIGPFGDWFHARMPFPKGSRVKKLVGYATDESDTYMVCLFVSVMNLLTQQETAFTPPGSGSHCTVGNSAIVQKLEFPIPKTKVTANKGIIVYARIGGQDIKVHGVQGIFVK